MLAGAIAVLLASRCAAGTVFLVGDLYGGLEAGHNLNKPATLDGVAVDLSHYGKILRGVLGADANFSVESADFSTVVFSIVPAYRVRIPAFDEPFETDYGQTMVGLSTKARHWFDLTMTFNPFTGSI